ncbi:MAG: LptF/LptG family permease [Verrucomicrobia bacterium]|nr:LptF/LptG family permease [Verrucomicrobiota bacterium]
MMRLLDRYLLRELLVPLSYCIGGFLIFWISFDVFSEINEFQRNKLKATDIAEYYLVRTPELLSVVLPVALLLALLYALTNHARHHELTAIRAAGISLWRLSLPYLAVGFFFSALLFAINELWVPKTQERSEEILTRYISETSATSLDWKKNLFFKNTPENRSWNIAAYNLRTGEMLSPTLIWELPGNVKRVINAERGRYSEGSWTFFNVQEAVTSPAYMYPLRTETNVLSFADFSETPELIRSEIKINTLSIKDAAKGAQLSLAEILDYFRLHPDLPPAQAAMLNTQLHSRIAAPWTCLVVVLIAIPFGAPSGRRNVFVGVAASIFIAFIYFILFKLGLALGTGGYLPGWLAAWLPNVFFAVAGIVLTLRVR